MIPVMIVDDEALMRKGLTTLIDWESLGCRVAATAENGKQALELYPACKPRIIISDIKMPLMDGLELARRIYEEHSETKVILLTAFADFEYARQAIQYGVTDYVPKTGSMDEIIAAVERCKSHLEKQRGMHMTREKHISVLIRSVLTGTLTDRAEIQRQSHEYGFNPGHFHLIAGELVSAGGEDPDRKDLRRALSAVFPKDSFYLVAEQGGFFSVMLTDLDEKSAAAGCRECVSMIQSLTSYGIYLGKSPAHPEMTELPKAHRQAREALSGRFYDREGFHNYGGGSPVPERKQRGDPLDGLRQALIHWNREACLTALDKNAKEHVQARTPEAEVKEESALMCDLFRAAMERAGVSGFPDGTDLSQYRASMSGARFHGDLCAIQRELAQKVCEVCERKSGESGDVIEEALAFISAHFREPITPKDVANAVHVSPGYLSRAFKSRTGKTPVDTITRMKIEYAQRLMSETNLKIFEVAQQAGFDDPAYFSHVFKKFTGVSAKSWQERYR